MLADLRPVDPKKRLRLLALLIPVLGCAGVAGYAADHAFLAWLTPLFTFVVAPLLDHLIGTDRSNPPESAVAALEQDPYYRRLVIALLPLQMAATVGGAWAVATLQPSWLDALGLLLTLGSVNGLAIVAAHEAGHKPGRGWRLLAQLELAPAAYGHFYVEHNRGHHRNVATPADPASARMGEGFWRFLPRAMTGALVSAWRLERQRLAARGRGPWTLHNHNLQAWSMTLVLYAGLTAWLGPVALAFLLVQALYAASLLEVVNYLEHYGLLREQDGTGRTVRCAPEHSWNSNHVVSNLLLYQLQRHSDHHAHATRSYQALRHFDTSPQLPSGYAAMLVLAWVPPLWFAVMDPRVARHYGGNLGRAHVEASARARLFSRYHQPVAVPRA